MRGERAAWAPYTLEELVTTTCDDCPNVWAHTCACSGWCMKTGAVLPDPGAVGGVVLSERFAAVAALVGRYGYQVLHQVGGEDGTDWEVTFGLGSMIHGQQTAIHHCAAPTEEALLAWLARWLPEQAAGEWRQQALILEAQIARAERA